MSDNKKIPVYNPGAVEKKWQKIWEKKKLCKIKDKVRGRRNFYHLVMFPYPSGDLHIGHWYNFAPADVYARFKRMRGFNVLSPMGFDAFGLPAENAAIKNKIHPRIWTYKNIATMKRQLKSMGSIYDWSKEIVTADPEYYKWTQWMFLKMYKAGLVYRKKALANWCPKDRVILANEQVIDGKCWRHPETSVIQKEVEQWMLRITHYAEELLAGLDRLDWPERTKLMQKNWIGKSVGAIIKFQVSSPKFQGQRFIEVFTTRPDTLFGATYIVLSPEHPLVEKIATKEQKDKVRHYIANSGLKTELERTSLEKEKTGVFTGAYAVNPANNEKIPIWVSDYVLMSYGTGAIMAVPAHDERDFEFAKKFNLPVIKAVDSGRKWPARNASPVRIATQSVAGGRSEAGGPDDKPYTEGGLLVNSGEFTGLGSAEARKKITEWLKSRNLGDFKTQYKLRDWIISRQRYWGAPIPVVYCEKCGIMPVSENKLPVKLPSLKNFKPVAGGKSPLARAKNFVNTKCPKCNGKAKRETDTMDTFVDSSWYFLRYADPKNKKHFASKEKIKNWLPVSMYVGGAEHAVLHLLYSRFFVKALKNIGELDFDEPFLALRHQGIIFGEDGQKMSKSRGNVADPDELVKKYGADAVRTHLCFMGDYGQGGPWNPVGILGVKRFLDRVYKKFSAPNFQVSINENINFKILLNQTIKRVGEYIENFRFNTAVSALMILFNAVEKEDIGKKEAESFLKLLSPFAPYLTEELWSVFGNKKSINYESWPRYEAELVKTEEYTLVIQINGKIRDKVEISKKLDKQEIEKLAFNRAAVKKYIDGKEIKKIIFVPERLINIVM